MVQHHKPCAWAQAAGESRQHRLLVIVNGKGQPHFDQLRAPSLCCMAGDILDRVIGLIIDQDLIIRPQCKRTDNRLDAGRGVIHENNVVSLGAQTFCNFRRGCTEALGQLRDEKIADGAFHLLPYRFLRCQYWLGRGAVAAVIDMRCTPIQRPLMPDGLAEFGHSEPREVCPG